MALAPAPRMAKCEQNVWQHMDADVAEIGTTSRPRNETLNEPLREVTAARGNKAPDCFSSAGVHAAQLPA